MKLEDASSKFALLGMLSMCPGSGYDIKKLVQSSIGYFWSESYGRIYPLLKKLTKEGLIRPEPGQGKSGRARQSYAITNKGKQALQQWLVKTPRLEPNRSELLLKIFFSGLVPVEVASAHVVERKLTEERNLASYERVEAQLQQKHARDPRLPYWLSTLSYGRHRSAAIVAWCDETIQRLSQIQRHSLKSEFELERSTK
jgi:DNA-binding PadR family transcriptional regulator